MRTFKLNEKFILLGIFLTMLLVFTPSTTMAGAGGVEPGEGCGLEGVKYAAPPYMGEVTVTWTGTNEVYAFGHVEQAGRPECAGSFNQVIATMELSEFQALKAKDLRQTCIENACLPVAPYTCLFNCLIPDAPLEVIAVGNMKWDGDYSFTATFIIMALE